MVQKKIHINGEERSVSALTVTELLVELSLAGRKIAIERNQVVVPKSAYDSTSLADGDRIEVVTFVGGG